MPDNFGNIFDDIPRDSVLHQITGKEMTFSNWEKRKMLIARQFERVALVVISMLVMFVFVFQGSMRDKIPILNMTLGSIFGLFFIFILAFLFVFIFGSSFFLRTKAGGSQGALKFNIIDKFTGSRQNDMEIDVLIKRHTILNRHIAGYTILEDIIKVVGDKAVLRLQTEKEDTFMQEGKTIDDLKKNPRIQALMKEANIYNKPKNNKKANSINGKNTKALVTIGNRPSAHLDALTNKGLIDYNESPLYKLLYGVEEVYTHILDVTPEYNYKGRKLSGIVFVDEEKDINKIFPQAVPVYASMGWNFGKIPMAIMDFCDVIDINGFPILITNTDKERNLKRANLGYIHENIPSKQSLVSSHNLIMLNIAAPLKKLLDASNEFLKNTEDNMNKISRKGVGVANRYINYWKTVHKPEDNNIEWLIAITIGFCIAVASHEIWIPILDGIVDFFRGG